jgi:hypothetical protein
MKVKGAPAQVYLRGKKLVDGENWYGQNGSGQYISRKPYAPVI